MTMLAKGRAIAARLLQASVEQMVFADGRFAVRDEPDRAIDLLAVRVPRATRPICRTACRRVWIPTSGTCWT